MTQQNTQSSLETVPAPPLPTPEPQKAIELPDIPNMLQYALMHRNVTTMWVERFYNSTQHMFRSVVNRAMNSHDIAVQKVDMQALTLILKNGSRLYFKHMQAPHYMRGYALSWVGVNKFIESDAMCKLYNEVLRPSQNIPRWI